jgi:hypothetical protein
LWSYLWLYTWPLLNLHAQKQTKGTMPQAKCKPNTAIYSGLRASATEPSSLFIYLFITE